MCSPCRDLLHFLFPLQQLQTGIRFAQRSYLHGLRECVSARTYNDDVSGWYAGWVPRHRAGVVKGAVAPETGVVYSSDSEGEEGDPEQLRLGRDSTKVTDASLMGLPAITLKHTRARLQGGSAVVSSSVTHSKSMGSLPSATGGGKGGRATPATKPAAVTQRSTAKKGSTTSRPLSKEGSARLSVTMGSTTKAEHPGTLTRYQNVLAARHEEANALVRKYIDPSFEDQPVNRYSIPP